MPAWNPRWRAIIRRRRRSNVVTERGHAARHYSRRPEPAGALRVFRADVGRNSGHQGHPRSARRPTRSHPGGRRRVGTAEATGDLRRPSAAGLRHRPALVIRTGVSARACGEAEFDQLKHSVADQSYARTVGLDTLRTWLERSGLTHLD